MNWPTPNNVLDVRYFMGLASYYLKFIKGFSKIAHLISSLQKKGIKFDWTLKCEMSFQKLKDMLTSALVLKIVNLDENFMICIDACQQSTGGVLPHNGWVICYESKKLKEHEQNYGTHDLALPIVVHALKIWRHYLMGNKFELRTDHHRLVQRN